MILPTISIGNPYCTCWGGLQLETEWGRGGKLSAVVDPRDPTLVSRQPAVLARGGSRILEEFGAKFGVERKNPRPNRGADREIRLLMMMAATLSCLPHLPQRLRRRAWGSLVFTG